MSMKKVEMEIIKYLCGILHTFMADTDTFCTTRDAHEKQADSIYVSFFVCFIELCLVAITFITL
jgi:hypothetical protein